MTDTQLLFIVLAGITWLIGCNLLFISHHRRLGKSGWSVFNPFAFNLKDLNAREWLILAVLAILTFTFFSIARSMAPEL